MKYVGAHVSASGGVQNAPLNAARIGARAMALFTRNQRRWHAPPLSRDAVTGFRHNLAVAGIRPEHVLPHDSYLINLASPDRALFRKSWIALLEETRRCDLLGIPLLVAHPGSHVGSGEAKGLARIAEALNRIFDRSPDGKAKIYDEVLRPALLVVRSHLEQIHPRAFGDQVSKVGLKPLKPSS